MALSEQEKQIVKELKSEGRTLSEIQGFLSGNRLNRNSRVSLERTRRFRENEQEEYKKAGFFSDAAEDLKEGFTKTGERFMEAGEDMVEINEEGTEERTFGEQVTRMGGRAFGGAASAFGEGFMGFVKAFIPQKQEDQAKELIESGAEAVMTTEAAQDLLKRYEGLDERTKEQVDAAFGFAGGLAEVLGAKGGGQLLKKGARSAAEAGAKMRTLFPENKTFESVDQVVETASKNLDESPFAESRAIAEAEAPTLTLQERYIGLSQAQKKRLQKAGPEKTQEYLDIVHARNLDDTKPTTYEYGGDKVRAAVKEIEEVLNDTGSKIGSARQKLATYTPTQPQLSRIEETFKSQLDSLNLTIKNGQVVQKPGTVTRVGSTGDINALTRLYDDLLAVKQSPNLTTLIDLRSAFDRKIRFGKRAGEVSNEVDPVSRQMRKEIADVAGELVGKSNAEDLTHYSNTIDALNELRSYTERRAGGEYLLRLVLSGRGGEARQIVNTVKEITGKDLMDDAVLMTLTTDLLGDSAQKTLFSQQITSAGIDTARLLKGDPTGVVSKAVEWGVDKAIDAERVIQGASGGARRGLAPGRKQIAN